MNRRQKKFQTPIAILTILSMLIVSSTAFAQEANNTDPNAGKSSIYLPIINSGTDNASEQSAGDQNVAMDEGIRAVVESAEAESDEVAVAQASSAGLAGRAHH